MQSVIQQELTELKQAMQETQAYIGQLEQQQQQLAQQHQQALQTLLGQRGAIQSAESMLKKLGTPQPPTLDGLPHGLPAPVGP